MFLLLCLATPALCQKASSFPSENVKLAEDLIEKGATNTAYFILKHELKSENLTKKERYSVLKLIARCFLKEMDYVHYDEYNRKAYELIKRDKEIYLAQFHLERAIFFNHLTWGDSVKYYAFSAKKIVENNKKDINLIDISLYYRILGVTYMYFDFKQGVIYPKGKYGMSYGWDKLFNYYDTAIKGFNKSSNKYSSDLSMIYRGVGNRYLDMISGYKYYSHHNKFKISKLGWYSFYKAVDNYHKSNKLLNKSNSIERVTNYSLLGLAYMCVGKAITAKAYFDSIHQIYDSKRMYSVSAPRLYLSALIYERLNDFNLDYDPIKNEASIIRLKKIIPQWVEFIKSAEGFTYDTFTISPFSQLFCYYTRKFFHTHDQKDAKQAVSYLLIEKNHFNLIKSGSNKFENYRKICAQNEIRKLPKNIQNEVLKLVSSLIIVNEIRSVKTPLINVSSIMSSLKNKEALLLLYKISDFYGKFKVLVTSKKIYYVKSDQVVHPTQTPDLSKITLNEFKKWSFKEYYRKMYHVYKLVPYIRKMYVLWDDDTDYDLMIARKRGQTFSDLSYLLQKTNFIKLYDFQSYFSQKNKLNNRLDYLVLRSPDSIRLPFMENFNPNRILNLKSYTHTLQNDFRNKLSQKGILHIVGHGKKYGFYTSTLKDKNGIVFYRNDTFSLLKDLNSKRKINRDLVVLSNCFSGMRVSYRFEFDRGIYLQLMKNGAKNVIANKDQVDDYVSSKIYHYFYLNIKKGFEIGDALVQAKRDFLKNNKNGYASPKYWNPYFSISNRRVVF